MRFAAYVGVSTALAISVVLRAFHQRPNFYSASVYLAQSQACRMILLNLLLLCVYSFVRGLQKLLYGPLRAIEREQLWDRSWYAITETALAMTTFRDEVGAFFLIMFVTLLAGKVWGWISEGRVEILEQQPPANPRLFHTRLIASLLVSELFDIAMLQYCIYSLLYQPRPGMMVMFAFEFAVLLITSTSTAARYTLSLHEIIIVKRQTKARLEERREEIRRTREEAEQLGAVDSSVTLPREEDIDENDVDVPGWQEKGRWILFLDLFTDFLKLVVYMLFFTMLLLFHGIPIHIIRDVYLTARSFIKRISDFQKYRNATKDMNTRYPDATPAEIQRDGTCIICREDMSPWQEQPEQPPAGAAARRPNRMPPDERQRPKKLPCGHILHLGCLKSWLERQQVCPTCRTSVLAPNPTSANPPNPPNLPPHLQPGAPGQRGLPDQPFENGGARQQGNVQQNGPRQQIARARTFNIGPWRFTLAAGNANEVRDAMHRVRGQGVQAQNQDGFRNYGLGGALRAWRGQRTDDYSSTNSLQQGLFEMERQIMQEIDSLRLAHGQLALVRALQGELARLRALQGQLQGQNDAQQRLSPATQGATQGQAQQPQTPVVPAFGAPQVPPPMLFGPLQIEQEVLTAGAHQQPLGPDHPDLPQGVTIPEGWSLLPLHQSGAEAQDPPRSAVDEILRGVTVTPQVPFTATEHSGPSEPQENGAASSSSQAWPHGQHGDDSGSIASEAPESSASNRPRGSGQSHHADATTNGSSAANFSSIPDWSQSNNSLPPAVNAERETDDSHKGGSMNGTPATNADDAITTTTGFEGSDKGKGKAATVEDVDDVGDMD